MFIIIVFNNNPSDNNNMIVIMEIIHMIKYVTNIIPLW